MRHSLLFAAASASLLVPLAASSQAEGPLLIDAEARMRLYREHLDLVARSPYGDLGWQFAGPTNISGRITDVAVTSPRGETYTLYVAGASSGVWKSVNEGVSWDCVFDEAPSMSIGDVTLDPSNQETVWVGTGEANIFRSSMAGAGVYRSRDGGETWEHRGLAETHTIARIVVHPEDPGTVYVAASGNEWTTNPERGVYRTRDGGGNWVKVLSVDDEAGAIDLVLDPSKPEVVYASTWQRTRERWNDPRNTPTTSGSGIWRSDDGGDSWSAINEGLPEPRFRGRIGIDLCASAPETVYAFVDNYELGEVGEDEVDSYNRKRKASIKGAEVYRSDDRGASWRRVSESSDYMRRLSATYGWVFGQLRVDPSNADRIYVMGLGLNVSEDGGKTFRRLRGMHGDHHALWIDPKNPRYLVNGNDGGVAISYDGGERWRTFYDNLPLAQFYNVGLDMAEPFRVYGSVQDHGSYRAEVDLRRGRDRVRAVEFERAPGGEASYHAIDPTDEDVVYHEGFYGSIRRAHMDSGERTTLELPMEDGEEDLRGQWLAPFLISPHNPRIIYHGMNKVFRSLDRGESFEAISPDLSFARDERKGDIPFQTVTTLAESAQRFGLLYAGTDDGRLHVTRDSGATWTELGDRFAPDRAFSRVEASRHTDGVVFAAQNGKRNEDFTPYLWMSHDHGETWRSIADGIPLGPINVIREDPKNPEVLYVGTDLGVYVSPDRGASWDALVAGLPNTFVHDLAVHPRDDMLVAGPAVTPRKAPFKLFGFELVPQFGSYGAQLGHHRCGREPCHRPVEIGCRVEPLQAHHRENEVAECRNEIGGIADPVKRADDAIERFERVQRVAAGCFDAGDLAAIDRLEHSVSACVGDLGGGLERLQRTWRIRWRESQTRGGVGVSDRHRAPGGRSTFHYVVDAGGCLVVFAREGEHPDQAARSHDQVVVGARADFTRKGHPAVHVAVEHHGDAERGAFEFMGNRLEVVVSKRETGLGMRDGPFRTPNEGELGCAHVTPAPQTMMIEVG